METANTQRPDLALIETFVAQMREASAAPRPAFTTERICSEIDENSELVGASLADETGRDQAVELLKCVAEAPTMAKMATGTLIEDNADRVQAIAADDTALPETRTKAYSVLYHSLAPHVRPGAPDRVDFLIERLGEDRTFVNQPDAAKNLLRLADKNQLERVADIVAGLAANEQSANFAAQVQARIVEFLADRAAIDPTQPLTHELLSHKLRLAEVLGRSTLTVNDSGIPELQTLVDEAMSLGCAASSYASILAKLHYSQASRQMIRDGLSQLGHDPKALLRAWQTANNPHGSANAQKLQVLTPEILRDPARLAEVKGKNLKIAAEARAHSLKYITANVQAIGRLEQAAPGSTHLLRDEFSIENFGRYPDEILIRQFERRKAQLLAKEKRRAGEKPAPEEQAHVGVIVFCKGDDGTFKDDRHTLASIHRHLEGTPNEITIYEAASAVQALKAVVRTYHREGALAFAGMIGHGNESVTTLSGVGREKDGVYTGDVRRAAAAELGAHLGRLFLDGAEGFLISCETGTPDGISDQLANLLRIVLSAPYDSTYAKNINARPQPNGSVQFDVTYGQGKTRRSQPGPISQP